MRPRRSARCTAGLPCSASHPCRSARGARTRGRRRAESVMDPECHPGPTAGRGPWTTPSVLVDDVPAGAAGERVAARSRRTACRCRCCPTACRCRCCRTGRRGPCRRTGCRRRCRRRACRRRRRRPGPDPRRRRAATSAPLPPLAMIRSPFALIVSSPSSPKASAALPTVRLSSPAPPETSLPSRRPVPVRPVVPGAQVDPREVVHLIGAVRVGDGVAPVAEVHRQGGVRVLALLGGDRAGDLGAVGAAPGGRSRGPP